MKEGRIVSFPLTCGTCGHIGRFEYLRWCAACRDAICPNCFPQGQSGLERCKRCIHENRPTQAELAGRRMAEEQQAKQIEEWLNAQPDLIAEARARSFP